MRGICILFLAQNSVDRSWADLVFVLWSNFVSIWRVQDHAKLGFGKGNSNINLEDSVLVESKILRLSQPWQITLRKYIWKINQIGKLSVVHQNAKSVSENIFKNKFQNFGNLIRLGNSPVVHGKSVSENIFEKSIFKFQNLGNLIRLGNLLSMANHSQKIYLKHKLSKFGKFDQIGKLSIVHQNAKSVSENILKINFKISKFGKSVHVGKFSVVYGKSISENNQFTKFQNLVILITWVPRENFPPLFFDIWDGLSRSPPEAKIWGFWLEKQWFPYEKSYWGA